MTLKPTTLLSYLASLVVPLALIGIAIRILLTPLYFTIEYNLPYFPVDEYGFTKADRLHWASYAVEYLVNSSDISYLGDLKFEGGLPLYNARELTHMADVKNVVQGFLRIWYLSLAILLVIGIFAWRGRWLSVYLIALRRGGWWMIGLALSLGLIAGVGILLNPDVFWQFFTLFHELFFTGSSWLFYYSDTLIRLFPIRFWQDAVLAVALLALAGGAGLALGFKRIVA
jgi:integral membrane protein (TIGR01906 family)